jgi:hypothetical protein
LIVFATIEGPRHGWGSPLIAGLYTLAVLAVAGLIAVDSRRPEPVIDLRFSATHRSPAPT